MTKRKLAFVAVLSTVTGVSIAAYAHLLPAGLAPGDTDKLFHFALGGTLAFTLDRLLRGRAAWASSPSRPGRSWLVAPPLSSVLVLLPLGIDEYCQRFSRFRTSSFGDFAADFLGVVVLTLVARALPPSARARALASG